jgi:hypothetical protein
MIEECAMDVASAPTGDRRPWSPEKLETNALQASDAEPFSCPGEIVFSQSQPVTALRQLIARVSSTLVRVTGSQRASRLGHVAIRFTHDQLAGLLGATSESSKAMADLASRGLIRQARRRTDLDGPVIRSNRMA